VFQKFVRYLQGNYEGWKMNYESGIFHFKGWHCLILELILPDFLIFL